MTLINLQPLLLKNGHVIDPATGLDSVTDILVRKGRITLIAPDITPEEGEEVIDAGGKYVVPGLIDCHVHLRDFEECQRETIASGTRAAVMGGFTAVICEPNTRPPLDSPERLEALREKVEREALCRVYAKAAMTRGREGEVLTDFKAPTKHNPHKIFVNLCCILLFFTSFYCILLAFVKFCCFYKLLLYFT